MKRETDSSLPKKKAELAALFKEWNINCSPFTFREYCSMNNKAIPAGESANLDLFEESDSDSDIENVENQVAVALLEFSEQGQSK